MTTARRLASRSFFFFLSLCTFCFAVSDAAATPADDLSRKIHVIFERAKSGVVLIEASDANGDLRGTGFFIDAKGTIYTSYNIGGATDHIFVVSDGKKYPARRLLADPFSGVAILKIDADTPALPIGKSSDLQIGSLIMTIGFPLDLPVSPNFGIVSGTDMKYRNNYFHLAHIRATLPAERGQGGAPLLDMNGEVVGILISRAAGSSESFSLPIEAAEKIRSDYEKFGAPHPGWIGVRVAAAQTPQTASESNVAVSEVLPHSPAEKAGMQIGDVVLQIGGKCVHSPPDVLNAAFYLTAGNPTTIMISRAGKKIAVSVVAATPPDPEAPIKQIDAKQNVTGGSR